MSYPVISVCLQTNPLIGRYISLVLWATICVGTFLGIYYGVYGESDRIQTRSKVKYFAWISCIIASMPLSFHHFFLFFSFHLTIRYFTSVKQVNLGFIYQLQFGETQGGRCPVSYKNIPWYYYYDVTGRIHCYWFAAVPFVSMTEYLPKGTYNHTRKCARFPTAYNLRHTVWGNCSNIAVQEWIRSWDQCRQCSAITVCRGTELTVLPVVLILVDAAQQNHEVWRYHTLPYHFMLWFTTYVNIFLSF